MAAAAPALIPTHLELSNRANLVPSRSLEHSGTLPQIASPLPVHFHDTAFALASSPAFRNLARCELIEIFSTAQHRCFDRRELLFLESDRSAHVAIILSGHVKVTRVTVGGDEVILMLSGAGDLIGEIGAGASVQQTSATALKSCSALLWDAKTFAELIKRHPILQQNVMHMLAERLTRTEERLSELATEKVAPRLARMLRRLLPHGERLEDGFLISLTREELAQLTGTTLFTVSRLLSQWESRGAVSARREAVLVRDPGGLDILAAAA